MIRKTLLSTALLSASISLLPFANPALAQQSPHQQATHPMNEVDLVTLKRVGSPVASPDGRWVVWQETVTDAESFKRSTSLWRRDMRNRSAAPERFVDMPDANEGSAAFSPDGARVYFLSNKSGKDQLWYVDLAGGEPVQASNTEAEIAGFKLAPTGNRIAIWGDIARNCAQFGCADDGDTSNNGGGSGRQYDQLLVRHWDSWETPGNYSRIFTFALDAQGKLAGDGHATDGDPKSGLTGDAPNKPFGGGEDINWSPDGSGIFYAARVADAQEALSTNLDIYHAPYGSKELHNITADNQGTDVLPTPSPDGRWLAWAAMERAGYEADRQVVQLVNLATGEKRALTAGWDRSVGSIAWAADSRSLIVTAQDTLQHPAYRVNISTGAVTPLLLATRGQAEGVIGDVSALPGGALLFTRASLAAPAEVWMRRANGKITQVSQANDAYLASLAPISQRSFRFAGANGDPVWGQIITPAGLGADTRLPVLLLVHGGPQGSFGNGWSWRWNPRVMAAQGFAVVTIDFHGSTGYGQAFTDSIRQDWGGKPLQDLRLGMAHLAANEPTLDTANACALGGSYGGYMMNWIAGNWPDGFKCLVTHAGVFDLRAMAFETEELWFDEWDQGGTWWQRKDAERWNPVNHVSSWKTPTLFIHGEKDFRISYSQSLAGFTAAQRQGIPSQLLVFPDENHWILKAKNSMQWHRSVFDWVDRWLKPHHNAIMAE